jgi:hypothetical protein
LKTPTALSFSIATDAIRPPSKRIFKFTTIALVALTLAVPSFAATGTLYSSGHNIPVGLLWLGSTASSKVLQGHVWIADANGFCRIDAVGTTGSGTVAATCAPGLLAVGAPTGQPDWDPATNNVYIPTVGGILRYTFNPSLGDATKESLSGPSANLGQPSVTGVAFGPDKKLYFGQLKDGSIQRITSPAGSLSNQLVQAVGLTSGTHKGAVTARNVFGLAFQGTDLYINATLFLQRIAGASLFCNGACVAEDLNLQISAVGSNSANLMLYAPSGVSLPPTSLAELIAQYDTSTLQTTLLSQGGITCSASFTTLGTCPSTATITSFLSYADVIAMTQDKITKSVYVVDDTSAGTVAGAGRVIKLWGTGSGATAQPPANEGVVPFSAPIPPSTPPAIPGNSATLVSRNGAGLTAPGVLSIGADVWALDPVSGICRVDSGRINLGTCVSIAPGIPGQSSYDPITQSVYVPDKAANSRGVWRFPYNTGSRTINGLAGTLVAANKGLGGNQPQCAMVGPDGSLYVSFSKNGSVLQITAPTTATNTVTQVAQSSDGHGIVSLAWITLNFLDGFGNPVIENDLYMLEGSALTYVFGADKGTKSKTSLVAPVQIANPAAMVSDGLDKIYIANAGEVDQYTVSTQTSVPYSIGSNGPPLTLFGNITGMARTAAGRTLIGDDPSGSAAPGQGRIWSLP